MIKRIGILLALVFAATAFSITPAHATGGAGVSGPDAGTVWFESYGEHFYVNDWDPDGYGVRGYLDVKVCEVVDDIAKCHYEREKTLDNKKGYYADAAHSNRSIRENRPIRYKACLINKSGDTFRCGSWNYDRA